VCYSLQMEKSMVEVVIHWFFCVLETVMALCCLYGFFLESFTMFSLVFHLLTVMVTILGCIWCYGVAMYVLIHLFGHCISFHLVVVSFCVNWHWHNCLFSGHYAKKYALGLLVVSEGCISIDIVMCLFDS
jgi:hypothetical protein